MLKKKATPKASTSWKVKAKYNNKNYDRILLICKKGQKEKIKALATKQGKSVSAFIMDLVNYEIKHSREHLQKTEKIVSQKGRVHSARSAR